jgi:SET domain-containing protein
MLHCPLTAVTRRRSPPGTKSDIRSSGDMESQFQEALAELPSQLRTSNLDVRVPLAVKDFGDRGRGIVALEDIEPGRLIERSPVLIIPPEDRPAVDKTIIFTYVFMWEHHTVEEDLYKHTGRSAIALGLTSLLSHSFEPNCNFVRHIDELFIDVFAKRHIHAGEELTIDYQMTLWFDPIKIA